MTIACRLSIWRLSFTGLCLALVPTLLTAQGGILDVNQPVDDRGNFVRLNEDTLFNRVTRLECTRELSRTTDQLVAEDRSLSEIAQGTGVPFDSLRRQTCGRAVLAYRRVPGVRGRPQLPLGSSWLAAAAGSARHWLRAFPNDTSAARMAAALAFAIDGPHWPAAEVGRKTKPTDTAIAPLSEAIEQAFEAGNRDPVLLRACTAVSLDANELGAASRCSNAALKQGSDSVWNLVRLAYIAARSGGSLTRVRSLMDAAIVSANSPTDRAILGWHLSYRTPGLFVDQLRLHSSRSGQLLAFTAATEWLRAGSARRLQIFWNRMDVLGAWGRVGDGVQYLYAHFQAIIHSGGDFRGCIVTAGQPRYWYAYCKPPYEVALPHTRQVTILARPVRLWDPNARRLVAVIPYALSTKAWSGTRDSDTVELVVRSWGTDSLGLALTHFSLPEPDRAAQDKKNFLTGYLTLPLSGREPVAWQLLAQRGAEGVVASVTTGLPELTGDSVILSDLVLGPPGLGLRWAAGSLPDDSIAVFPAATMQKGSDELELEVQAKSSVSLQSVRGSIAVRRVASRGVPEKEAFSLSWQMPIEKGIHLIRRSIDISRLSGGTYEIEFALNIPTATSPDTVSRRARFTIP